MSLVSTQLLCVDYVEALRLVWWLG